MEDGTFWAKPDETIDEHVKKLLTELERMRAYGYIQDDDYHVSYSDSMHIMMIHHHRAGWYHMCTVMLSVFSV